MNAPMTGYRPKDISSDAIRAARAHGMSTLDQRAGIATCAAA